MPDVIWWHGSREPIGEIRPFLHAGTIEQARMRGGRDCHLTCLSVVRGRMLRRRDTGSWKEADLRRAAASGAVAIVYLNRFEGITLEEFDAARARCPDIDALSDARFRKLLPSACDSIVVLDPASLRIERAAP